MSRLICPGRWACVCVVLAMLGLQPAQAQDLADPMLDLALCAELPPDASAQQLENCIDAAAPAIGEIDPSWRERMPPKVRWVVNKEALSTCQTPASPYGRLAGPVRDQGCVWLSEGSCTILTVAYLAHAELAQILRMCAVR